MRKPLKQEGSDDEGERYDIIPKKKIAHPLSRRTLTTRVKGMR